MSLIKVCLFVPEDLFSIGVNFPQLEVFTQSFRDFFPTNDEIALVSGERPRQS